ncbi:MAG: acetate/propionate family kinase [Acidobacteriota bacterium]
MKIVVCNIGSTSFKFQLLEMPAEQVLARGVAERVGAARSRVTCWAGGVEVRSAESSLPGQGAAVRDALDFLARGPNPPLSSLEELDAVGFKCVQAGERNGSLIIDQEVVAAMDSCRDLAPAHNPAYLEAIAMFRDLLPQTPLVGVFEPGFHVDAPEYAKVYGTPYEWFEKYGVRRYGYHGASHRFAASEVVQRLGLSPRRHRIVNCHLGGSSSLCAVRNGVSIDTSMGFSPQSGLIQGSRVGDLDPFSLPYVMRRKGITLEEALRECSEQGGLAGISGTSGDMRDINDQIRAGSRRARLARDKFIYDIKRYLGSYLLLMEGLDAVSFSGGTGEHDAPLRAEVLESLGFLGLRLDESANRTGLGLITTPDSTIAALVVQANEEIIVARETVRVLAAR